MERLTQDFSLVAVELGGSAYADGATDTLVPNDILRVSNSSHCQFWVCLTLILSPSGPLPLTDSGSVKPAQKSRSTVHEKSLSAKLGASSVFGSTHDALPLARSGSDASLSAPSPSPSPSSSESAIVNCSSPLASASPTCASDTETVLLAQRCSLANASPADTPPSLAVPSASSTMTSTRPSTRRQFRHSRVVSCPCMVRLTTEDARDGRADAGVGKRSEGMRVIRWCERYAKRLARFWGWAIRVCRTRSSAARAAHQGARCIIHLQKEHGLTILSRDEPVDILYRSEQGVIL